MALVLDTLHEELRSEQAAKLMEFSHKETDEQSTLQKNVMVGIPCRISGRRFSESIGSIDNNQYSMMDHVVSKTKR